MDKLISNIGIFFLKLSKKIRGVSRNEENYWCGDFCKSFV